jgi:hypothetical protein
MAKGHAKKVLGRDAFLASSISLKKEPVELANGIVYIRELSGKGLLDYREKIEALQKINPEITPSSSIELMASLVAMTACDETGNLLFTEDDVKQLMEGSLADLLTLSKKALSLSGVPQNVIDEVAVNLKNAPISSTTDSPTNSEGQ